MRGHDELIALRRTGRVPGLVFLSLERDPWRTWSGWSEWSRHAHIEVDPAESIATLDLRCMVGLTVLIDGEDEFRVLALHEACKEAKAKRVISRAYRPIGGADFECVANFDTATETLEV